MAYTEDLSFLEFYQTNEGDDLKSLSFKFPVMLVFLRQFGCTFCREAMSDIAAKRKNIEALGTKIVLVHLSDSEEVAKEYLNKYQLQGIAYIGDPEARLYQLFGLKKGSMSQLFGLNVWMRGIKAGISDGHGLGWLMGDGFQMPGIFLLKNGAIQEKFIHNQVSDRPDYEKIAQCCSF